MILHTKTKAVSAFLALLILSGCSRRDPPTLAPSYRNGTPTNRSSVNSWEIGTEPFHTQPGVNGGKPVTLKPIPSQRGFEPNDPLAEAVYSALIADGTIPTKYITTPAKDGVVILEGTIDTKAQAAHAVQIARGVPGVKRIKNQLQVVTSQASP